MRAIYRVVYLALAVIGVLSVPALVHAKQGQCNPQLSDGNPYVIQGATLYAGAIFDTPVPWNADTSVGMLETYKTTRATR